MTKKKINILLVEDELVTAKDTKDVLECLGYIVTDIVSSGEVAITKASETNPDIVLTDIKLKGNMDGIQAAKLIWERLRIPVVYLSAYMDDDTLQRAKATSPYGFIQKPFETRVLQIGIEMAINKHSIEQSLRESEEKFRQIAENIPQVFWITSLDFSQMIYVSPAYETIWGRTCKSLYEQPESWLDSIHKDDREGVRKILEKHIMDKEGFEVEYRIARPDGSVRWISDRAFSVKSQTKEADRTVRIAEDITFRKMSQISQHKLSFAVMQSPASIVITDSDGNIEYVNAKFTKTTGYTLEEVMGKTPRILKTDKTPADIHKQLWETITSGGEWRGEFCNRKKDGGLYWERAAISPIKDPKGKITHYLAVNEDLTEQKQKDKLLMMKTRQSQMGEMLSMIAHQWKQPLTSINAIVSNTMNRLVLNKTSKEDLIGYLDKIQQQVYYLSQTINDFKDFFKPNRTKEPVKMVDTIQKCLDIIGGSLEINGINISTSFESGREIVTYSNELVQVFLNILKNSEDVLKGRMIEHPTVSIREYEDDRYVVVDITDNAGGVPEEIIEDIFLPYFSNKDDMQGTGLGLYMCKTIVEEHCKGEIKVQNTDVGAKFTIKLPFES